MEWKAEYFDFPDMDENGEFVGLKKGRRWHLQFADDEKADIRYNLQKYAPGQVDLFLDRLRKSCEDYAVFLLQKAAAEELDEAITEALPALRKTQKHLERIVKGLQNKGLPTPLGYLKSVPGGTENNGELPYTGISMYADCLRLASQIQGLSIPLVDHLIKSQRHYHETRNRRKIEGGFAQAVADLFSATFDEPPSLWREGNFSEILKICLEGLDLNAEDPDRRLKAIRRHI